MYTRQVTTRLKRNAAAELEHVVESVVLPLLRRHRGFRDLIMLVAPERLEAVCLSFWDTEADAEAYNRTAYTEELQALKYVAEKNPRVETYTVANSTLHRTAVSLA